MTPRRSIALLLGAVALTGCHLPSVLATWEERVGPTPNLPLPTLGGAQLWSDVAWRDGWRVQRHCWTGHHRLLDPGNRRRAWGTRERCERTLRARADAEPEGTHLVVLLHGLARTRRSMRSLGRALEAEGRRVARLTYASTRESIERHAADLRDVLAGLEGVTRVSFVTHSLGGIVARTALADPEASWRGRIEVASLVQIAPPNGGSQTARRLDLAPFRWFLGPSFTALARRGPEDAGRAEVDTTVLIGDGGRAPWIDGPDDLLVGVEEARLEGAPLHVLPGARHTFVANDPRAHELVLAALGRAEADDAPR